MSEFAEPLERVTSCCACRGSLDDSQHVNVVLLGRKATWEHPVSGNVLSGYGPEATAILCDACVDAKRTAKVAIEFRGDEVVLHPIEELEELPPEPTYVLVHKSLPLTKGIQCLRCGLTSWHPQDVANRYCGHCKLFHER